MDELKLSQLLLKRYKLGLFSFPDSGKTWNEVCRELGIERIGPPNSPRTRLPEGYVEVSDPGSFISGDRLRMTEETALKILTLGTP